MTESTESSNVSVLVVDDQRLMRDGIASLLEIQEGIKVVGTAANGQEAIEKALALRPDVILMDVRMPGMDGVAATAQVLRQMPACHVLMLTTFDDDEYIIDALQAGASGYLLKDIPAHDLASAVQAVHRGIYQLDQAVANKIVSSLARSGSARQPLSRPSPPHTTSASNAAVDLTEREVEVLRLIAQGATNREIATQLVISEGTVKNHISNILGRLGLRDRTQAAIYARENGLL
jgi:DNA-binding NarL/FixJ family response regulator